MNNPTIFYSDGKYSAATPDQILFYAVSREVAAATLAAADLPLSLLDEPSADAGEFRALLFSSLMNELAAAESTVDAIQDQHVAENLESVISGIKIHLALLKADIERDAALREVDRLEREFDAEFVRLQKALAEKQLTGKDCDQTIYQNIFDRPLGKDLLAARKAAYGPESKIRITTENCDLTLDYGSGANDGRAVLLGGAK